MKGGHLASNDFVPTLNIIKIERGDPFVTSKNSLRNIISGIRYMGCVIVEGLLYSSNVVCRWPKGTEAKTEAELLVELFRTVQVYPKSND